MSKQLMEVGLGLNLDNVSSFIHGTGLPGASGGLSDQVSRGSLYVNESNGSIWRKFLDGTGSDKWTEIPGTVTPKGINNFSGLQVIDYYLVDDATVAKWIVEVNLSSDNTRRYIAEVTAAHNGTTLADATRVDFNEFGILSLGTAIPGLSIACSLNGSGVSQTVNLQVGASQNVDVITRRLSFGEQVGPSTPLDLSTVPHDISSTMLGSPVASQPILFYTPTRTFTIPANFTNSKALCSTAPGASIVFTVQKSSSPYSSSSDIGTITFSAGNKVGSFSTSSLATLVAGDLLRIMAPASVDATIKDICVTLQANYV